MKIAILSNDINYCKEIEMILQRCSFHEVLSFYPSNVFNEGSFQLVIYDYRNFVNVNHNQKQRRNGYTIYIIDDMKVMLELANFDTVSFLMYETALELLVEKIKQLETILSTRENDNELGFKANGGGGHNSSKVKTYFYFSL